MNVIENKMEQKGLTGISDEDYFILARANLIYVCGCGEIFSGNSSQELFH